VLEKAVKTKNKLIELSLKGYCQLGGGRKTQATDMKEALTAWIEELKGSHAKVTRTSIQKKVLLFLVYVLVT